MHDTLPSKGMSDVSRDLLIFWETSDNISLTVQDIDSRYNVTLIGNCMWTIEWYH